MYHGAILEDEKSIFSKRFDNKSCNIDFVWLLYTTKRNGANQSHINDSWISCKAHNILRIYFPMSCSDTKSKKKKKDSTPKEFLKEFLEDTHEVNVLISFEYTELLISSYTLQGKWHLYLRLKVWQLWTNAVDLIPD